MKRILTALLPVLAILASAPRLLAQAPQITAKGTVNAADYSRDLAPGALISVFGSNLSSSPMAAPALPLPTALGGTSVELVGPDNTVYPCAVYYVSPGQVNAELPFGVAPGSYTLRVKTAQGTSNGDSVALVARAPKFFTPDFSGKGNILAVDVTNKMITLENPSRAADYIVLYMNSMGEVTNAPGIGQAAPGLATGSDFSQLTEAPTVLLNGVPATILFAGLTPGLVGLYQLNVRMPLVLFSGNLTFEVKFTSGSAQLAATTAYLQPGFYYAVLGGKMPAGQTPNAVSGANSALAFRQADPVSWGPEGLNAWSKNTRLPSTYSVSPGLALTLRNGATTVFDNNGIEDKSYGSFYDNTNGGDNSLKPGLANVYSMSNYNAMVFSTYVKVTQPTTIGEIIGYFDAQPHQGVIPFDPTNPYVRYRMNIWSSAPSTVPKDTKNFVGDVVTSDTTPGTFAYSDTLADRIFTDPKATDPKLRNLPDRIWRISFKPATPITLQPGEYWFSHDAALGSEPVSNTGATGAGTKAIRSQANVRKAMQTMGSRQDGTGAVSLRPPAAISFQ